MGALQVCKALGTQITFENLNGSAVSLWCMPLDAETLPDVELGTEADRTTTYISVPRQTNFPPDDTDTARYGIVTDAEVTMPVGGQVYSVRNVKANSVGAAFRLTLERMIAKRGGVS